MSEDMHEQCGRESSGDIACSDDGDKLVRSAGRGAAWQTFSGVWSMAVRLAASVVVATGVVILGISAI